MKHVMIFVRNIFYLMLFSVESISCFTFTCLTPFLPFSQTKQTKKGMNLWPTPTAATISSTTISSSTSSTTSNTQKEEDPEPSSSAVFRLLLLRPPPLLVADPLDTATATASSNNPLSSLAQHLLPALLSNQSSSNNINISNNNINISNNNINNNNLKSTESFVINSSADEHVLQLTDDVWKMVTGLPLSLLPNSKRLENRAWRLMHIERQRRLGGGGGGGGGGGRGRTFVANDLLNAAGKYLTFT